MIPGRRSLGHRDVGSTASGGGLVRTRRATARPHDLATRPDVGIARAALGLIVAVTLLVGLALPTAAGAEDGGPSLAAIDEASSQSAVCGDLEVVSVEAGTCTTAPEHGLAGLAALPRPGPGTARAAVTCTGNGTDGGRVQMVYARPADRPDRSATAVDMMQGWATSIDGVYVRSAQKTGDIRRVRWVHDQDCRPTVQTVTVPAGVDGFVELVAALRGTGMDDVDRKYLVAWDNAATNRSFCGLAELRLDSSPGPGNANDDQLDGSQFAAVDAGRGCWVDSIAAHELTHLLGAVQHDAPHTTGHGHCTDESDLMCYVDVDDGSVTLTFDCAFDQEALLDCGDDDYFHTSPPPGSYLATHWNVADSRFLHAGGPRATPPGAPLAGESSAAPGSITVEWQAPLDDGGSPVVGYVARAEPGGRTTSVGADVRTATLTGLAEGVTTTVWVSAVNAAGEGAGVAFGDLVPSPAIWTVWSARAVADLAAAPGGGVYLATARGVEWVDRDGAAGLVDDGGPTSQVAVGPGGALHVVRGDEIRLLDGGGSSLLGTGAGGCRTAGGATVLAMVHLDDIEVLDDGSVLVLDRDEGRICRLVGGEMTLVAGTGDPGGPLGDGGPALAASLSSPADLAVERGGAGVIVADTGHHRVRRLVVGGAVETVIGNGTDFIQVERSLPATGSSVPAPAAVAVVDGTIVVSDATARVRRLVGDWVVQWVGRAYLHSDGQPWDSTPVDVVRLEETALPFAVSEGTFFGVFAPGVGGTPGMPRVRAAGPWADAEPATVPGPAPTVDVHGREGGIDVTWVPPANGGSPITAYRVVVQPAGTTIPVNASATSLEIGGLPPGTHTVRVRAINDVGAGPVASSGPVVVPATAPFAPFDSWDDLVARQYRDVLGRGPTASESTVWRGRLDSGDWLPGDVVDFLRRTTAQTTLTDPVARLYRAFFLRPPDAFGLSYWVGQRTEGWSLSRVADHFARSSEFAARYGALDTGRFVDLVYDHVLGRSPDPGGRAFWVEEIDSGRRTRGFAMIGFSESSEHRTAQAEAVDGAVAHVLLLGREPTSAELVSWVARQRTGTAHSVLAGELLASVEYAGRIRGG